jgi:hypothetical protein
LLLQDLLLRIFAKPTSTLAFLDVGKEPWVLSIPDMKGRYALFPMLDGWTTVFQVPGKRTTGTAASDLCNHWSRLEGHLAGWRRSTNRPPVSSGCSTASIAPAHLRTMQRSTSFRTNSSWCRSASTAIRSTAIRSARGKI